MKRGVLIALIAGILLVLIGGFFVLTNNDNNASEGGANTTQMIDCGKLQNPSCFSTRMSTCLPVKAQLTGTDGSNIEIIILGMENGTCHFQREINNVPNLNCYFPDANLTWDLIDQTFGNDKGLQSIVDNSCTNV